MNDNDDKLVFFLTSVNKYPCSNIIVSIQFAFTIIIIDEFIFMTNFDGRVRNFTKKRGLAV